MCFNFNPKILHVFLYFCILVWLFVIFYFNLLCKEILAHMTGAELHRSELSAVTASSYLIQTMSTQTARLKIQLLTLSASTVSHTAVTAFCHMIILMMQTAILPRLSKTANSLTSTLMTVLTSLKKNMIM